MKNLFSLILMRIKWVFNNLKFFDFIEVLFQILIKKQNSNFINPQNQILFYMIKEYYLIISLKIILRKKKLQYCM